VQVALRAEVLDVGYAKPIYAREDINTAGKQLAGTVRDFDEQHALAIINNWRSSHAFPLNIFYMSLRGRARKIDSNALTAQRLKRLPSIGTKLSRFPDMKLSQMQDLGGCRAVVRDAVAVDKLIAAYKKADAKNPKARHEFLHKKDYIADPKPDGYRSYHMVYRYRSRAKKHIPYNGLKIEIQIRTKLQHAWATAVEIISTFTGQALKSNIGDECWKRFFKLMSSEIAMRENRPLVPDVPANRDELVAELRTLVQKLQVQTVLQGWGAGVNLITQRIKGKDSPKRSHSYLLVLDSNAKTIEVFPFAKEELPKAQQRYLDVEKENVNKPEIQAVLVSVDSVAALRRAYPNYYLDSFAFSQAVGRAIGVPNGKQHH
jgi:ppGpp synthetase/RelA/SpoT-type nucleotidyltranferase